ncbi:MAG TPA: efflux RND transporter periplasmic adaptor subunit [Candidatus Polarisedimenticolia bacterium]|nr:efflux RND transporter periplasmic adaptor subunit [Candidatus Polarisedimenticolia bacterium]
MTSGYRRLLTLAGIAALLAVGAAGGILWQTRRDDARPVATARDLYHCPMHPTVVADRPGDCPICGMRLVRATVAPAGGGSAPDEGAAPVEGQAGVTIGNRKQQLINVRTVAASRAPFVRTLRVVGRVVPDETRLHHLHTKVGGWVEMLHLTSTGAKVEQGAPLLDLYSPELVASQEEYMLALRSRAESDQGALPEVARRADDLAQSARRRLLLFDMTPQQIEELEQRGEPRRTVTIYSPISGYVIARNVTHGEKISPDMALFDIANLARVWVMASVYEYELPFVQPGQAATTTLASLPGEPLSGRVDIIYPTLDEATRTAQVRLEFDNPRLQLKPGMYAEVQIRSELGSRLSIPASAVVESGTRSIVFVEQGGGYFAPREVRIGLRLPDTMEVIAGLAENEKVVASGTFFVDSESKLKAALESAAAGRTSPPAQAPPGPRKP